MKRALTLLALCLGAGVALAEDAPPVSFVVLGHLRGDPMESPSLSNKLLPEIVARCRRLKPDVVVLTGDAIWGFPTDEHPVRQRDDVAAEWEVLDRELAKIGAPVLRTPGNHDISSLRTRDVFEERYGKLPRVQTIGRCRLILLASAWIPADGDQEEHLFPRGKDLDDAQLAFLRKELADDGSFDHAFVFMHHMLWREEGDDWMRRVHPQLVGTKLRAVFSGDYGPAKYTYVQRDGIRYVQTSIETEQEPESLRVFPERRLLNAQMDMFARVVVEGPDVHFEMVPVGVTTTERYTPERWQYVNGRTLSQRIWYETIGGGPRQKKLAVFLVGLGFGVGVLLTAAVWWLVRRRARRARQLTMDN